MAHWICRAIASEQEFMVFVLVLIAAATFLAIGAIVAWMPLVGLHRRPPAIIRMSAFRGQSGNAVKAAQPTLMTRNGQPIGSGTTRKGGLEMFVFPDLFLLVARWHPYLTQSVLS